jgi:hypothetical protein
VKLPLAEKSQERKRIGRDANRGRFSWWSRNCGELDFADRGLHDVINGDDRQKRGGPHQGRPKECTVANGPGVVARDVIATVLVCEVLTHSEYSKEQWKERV